MATARYTVLVPIADELGQKLNVSLAAYQHLTDEHKQVERATVHPGNPYDALVAWAQETPEMDSTIKQLAVYVAEVANVPLVTATKEGKSSVTWHMRNPHYRVGDGAEPVALSQTPDWYGTDTSTPGHTEGTGTQTPPAWESAESPSSPGNLGMEPVD